MSAVQPPHAGQPEQQQQPAAPSIGVQRHRRSLDTHNYMKGARLECASLANLLRGNAAVFDDERATATAHNVDMAITAFLETSLPLIIEAATTARHIAWRGQLDELKTAEHERALIRQNEYVAKLNAEYDARKKGAAD